MSFHLLLVSLHGSVFPQTDDRDPCSGRDTLTLHTSHTSISYLVQYVFFRRVLSSRTVSNSVIFLWHGKFFNAICGSQVFPHILPVRYPISQKYRRSSKKVANKSWFCIGGKMETTEMRSLNLLFWDFGVQRVWNPIFPIFRGTKYESRTLVLEICKRS